MKQVIISVSIALLCAGNAVAQTLGSSPYPAGVQLNTSAGTNFYGPLAVNRNNQLWEATLSYSHVIKPASDQHPAVGLYLPATLTLFNKRLDDPAYIRYSLMQPGTLGINPRLYLSGSPTDKLTLFVSGGPSVNFFPLLSDSTTQWDNNDTFEQFQLRGGGGFYYSLSTKTSLQASVDFAKHWLNLTTRTEEYYKRAVSSDTDFSSIRVNVTFTPIVIKDILQVYIASNWYGRPSGDPRTKYLDVRIGTAMRIGKELGKLLKKTPEDGK
jgi:hypothetical protein